MKDQAKKQAGPVGSLSSKEKKANKKRTSALRRQNEVALRYAHDERTEPHITF